MCDSGKGETFCEGNNKEQSARKISRCARNDGGGENGFILRSVQRICWENTTSATSSRAESRDLSCRRGSCRMCDSRKRESICEGRKKARSARKISRCARNDGMGEWVYFT